MKKVNKVLLLDDDPVSTYLNKCVINKSGICNVIDVATSEQEGLNWIYSNCHKRLNAEHPRDGVLVFSDMSMTAINGFEFLRTISKLRAKNIIHLPSIYFLTGSLSLENSVVVCGEYPVQGFFTKFLTEEDISLLVEETL
ncbi:response regulator [Pontibacter sp. FD36]|uniref:response regulator n=1 Tax=Pontibacter sp. FD36 TaxID=2789860 RepID=UPI0018AB43D9|nr:response regulator [Pontibacter sp. FD36]MBF8964078.1 response regulator [Pontibacter sp. FD36]